MTKKKMSTHSPKSIEEIDQTGKLPQTGEEITYLCEEALLKTKEMVASIITMEKKERNFENTAVAVDRLSATLWSAGSAAYLLKEVHPEEEVRKQSEECVLNLEKYSNELMLRRDFYDAINQFKLPAKYKGVDKKYYKELMLGFKRSGVALPEEKRNKLQALKNEMSKLELEFSKNIAADKTTVKVSKNDLDGFPERNKAGLKEEGGFYVLSMDPPTVVNVMTYVHSEDTRKKVFQAYLNKAYPVNVPILEKIVEKRHQMAKTLGYKNYAEYQLEDLMAKNVKAVRKFLDDLRKRAKTKAFKDLKDMEKVKRKKTGNPKAKVYVWDRGYYRNIIKETQYKIDEEKVSEYFSVEATVKGIFTISEKLYGIKIKETEAPWKWHDDVKFYEVTDNETGGLMGRFYTDLYPRENKYSHAAKFGIVSGRENPDGSYLHPVVAIVANFPKATKDTPALLKHRDVETFFHEFGHCLHSILTSAKYADQSGTSVKRDFVEAPSQMFENWVWNSKSLSLFAKHYKTGEVLPKKLLNAMIKAKNLNSGIDTQQQIYYSDISLSIYSSGPKVNTDKLVKDLHKKHTLFEYFDGTHFQASFGHLTGYGAGYYGYNWSKVYAEDMFTRFGTKSILSPKIGMQYRKKVLARGSSRDEMKSVVDFLGRKPNSKAFFKSLGF